MSETQPVRLDAFHTSIWTSFKAGDERALIDSVNHWCPQECEQCAVIFCPHHHPLHYHHDDCPACVGADSPYPAPTPTEATQ